MTVKSFDSKKHLINEEFCYACGFSNKSVFSFNKYFNESYLKSLFSIYFGKKYLKILKNENTYIAVLTSFHKKFLKDRYSKSKNVFVILTLFKQKLQMKSNKRLLHLCGPYIWGKRCRTDDRIIFIFKSK